MTTLTDLVIKNSKSDSIAIIYVDSDANISILKYDELWSLSDMIELKIKQTINAHKNLVIGIYSEVNELIPSLMMAIMKNSCLFCYISMQSNPSGIPFLIKSLNYIICHQKSRQLFENFTTNAEIKRIDDKLIKDYIIIKLNDNNYNNRLRSLYNEQSFAYLITSSGTSGGLKHVYVPHSCITPNIIDLKQEYNMTSSDATLICSPFTFDPSIVDLFIGLSSNSQIVLTDDLIRRSPQKLVEVIKRFKISIMTVTPSFMCRFSLDIIQNELLSSKTHLRVLVFGGEKSPSIRTIRDYIKLNTNKTVIYNIYGVTEVSGWATIYKLNQNDCFDEQLNSLPISGRNLLDTTIAIEDSNNELIIKSDVRKCLVFTFDKNEVNCHSEQWSFIHRTGDCAQISKCGLIYITGRYDSMVKLNGKICDLEFIESKVEQQFNDSIAKCVCIASEWHHIQNSIINVFIYEKKEQTINIKTLVLDFLHKQFDKSIAFNIIIRDCIPLTTHSKIDRSLLSRKETKDTNNDHLYQTRTQIVKCISNHLKFYLNVSLPDFSVDELPLDLNCQSFGIDSIRALQIAINVENDLNCDLPSLVDKILNNNISQICEYVYEVLTHLQYNPHNNGSEQRSNSIVSSNSLKSRYSDVTGDCAIIYTRRGLNTISSGPDDSCSIKRIKLIDSNQSNKAEILWSIDLFQCIDASPLIVELVHRKLTVAFIGSHSGVFASINISNGTIIWKIQLNDRIESSAISNSGGDYVFIGDYSGNFYCIHAINGYIIWRFKTEASIKSSPICSTKSDLVFCGSHDKYLYAWNQLKSEHQLVWKCLISGGSVFSSPILSTNEDLIFAATLDGILAAIQVNLGSIVWKINLKSALFSSPAIYKDILVIGSTQSSLIAINTNDGTIIWSLNTEKAVFCSPFITNYSDNQINNIVLIGTHNNSVLCVDVMSGQMKWQFKTSSPVYSTPFFNFYDKNGFICVAETNGILHSIDENDGKEVFNYKMNGQLFSSPVVYDKKVFIGCRDDHFYCISWV